MTQTNAMVSTISQDKWIVDSDSGHHLNGDDSKLSSIHFYEGNDAIVTADNTKHPVKKEGIIIFNGQSNDHITLRSVFHVRGVKKNLFSVANDVDSGHCVLFGPKDTEFLKNIES